MAGYEKNFLYALLITVTIESAVVYLLMRYLFNIKLASKDAFMAGVLPSLATLPYAWFVAPMFLGNNYTLYLWVSEISGFIVEVFILAYLLKIDYKKATILSFVANLASWSIGGLFW